ncbi:1-phosphofructokinase family hexose kinase [Chryseobacterium sp.]|uniref:1-phosphofructokinase family hexose kinase n=1 Tax=Chryseobacterium sp. TaxID=1871047 RepID=UPI0011C970DE|nr:1-phosphofructokinase family hexose kinase [Chryseobacterium sp.]TXF79012.1 1-phosphofructokinase family hexose kinase [Chryseobacterium sp.]
MRKTVLTITLNPSVDKSSSVENIIPEKKLRCSTPVYEAGGGGINVSRGLKRLGIPSEALFTCGGKAGTLLESLVDAEGPVTVPISVHAETRENFTVTDTSNNRQYRFVFPGETLAEEEQKHLLNLLHAKTPFPDFAVISGSLPPGTDPDFVRQIIRICSSKGSTLIADTSGNALQAALEEGIFLVKPNIGELATLAGKDHLEAPDIDRAAQQLISEGKAELVVVSLGSKGAVLFSKDEKIQLEAPPVQVRSTVGAGDSMVAGMVSVLMRGGNSEEILLKGIACGTATTMVKGTGLFTKKNAEHLFALMQQARQEPQ